MSDSEGTSAAGAPEATNEITEGMTTRGSGVRAQPGAGSFIEGLEKKRKLAQRNKLPERKRSKSSSLLDDMSSRLIRIEKGVTIILDWIQRNDHMINKVENLERATTALSINSRVGPPVMVGEAGPSCVPTGVIPFGAQPEEGIRDWYQAKDDDYGEAQLVLSDDDDEELECNRYAPTSPRGDGSGDTTMQGDD